MCIYIHKHGSLAMCLHDNAIICHIRIISAVCEWRNCLSFSLVKSQSILELMRGISTDYTYIIKKSQKKKYMHDVKYVCVIYKRDLLCVPMVETEISYIRLFKRVNSLRTSFQFCH